MENDAKNLILGSFALGLGGALWAGLKAESAYSPKPERWLYFSIAAVGMPFLGFLAIPSLPSALEAAFSDDAGTMGGNVLAPIALTAPFSSALFYLGVWQYFKK